MLGSAPAPATPRNGDSDTMVTPSLTHASSVLSASAEGEATPYGTDQVASLHCTSASANALTPSGLRTPAIPTLRGQNPSRLALSTAAATPRRASGVVRSDGSSRTRTATAALAPDVRTDAAARASPTASPGLADVASTFTRRAKLGVLAPGKAAASDVAHCTRYPASAGRDTSEHSNNVTPPSIAATNASGLGCAGHKDALMMTAETPEPAPSSRRVR
mmetsp:Transcript_4896/g.12793  ORF Transcript_4896/g.12793 Transcript_4896/m.12793 type:complete len:219 (+) Transcript_4896:212-868(+)